MFINGDYTKEEYIELLLSNNNIDKQTAEAYLYPRWQRYKFLLFRLASKNSPRSSQSEKESSALLGLLVSEAIVRSAIKQIRRQAIDDKEAATMLKSHYDDINSLLVVCQNNFVDFSTPVGRMYLKEKPAYEQLLEDLALDIRKASNGSLLEVQKEMQGQDSEGGTQYTKINLNKGSSKEFVNIQQPGSSLEHMDAGGTPGENIEFEQKGIHITFSESAQQTLEKHLLPYIELKNQETLRALISGAAIEEPVLFKGSLSQLIDIFKELKNAKLYVYQNATDIGRWVAAHFVYYNQQIKSYDKIKEQTAIRYFRENQRQHRQL